MYNPIPLKAKVFHTKAFVDVEYKQWFAVVYTNVAWYREKYFSLLRYFVNSLFNLSQF